VASVNFGASTLNLPDSKSMAPLRVIRATVEGVTYEFLLDTGSQPSLLHLNVWRRLKARFPSLRLLPTTEVHSVSDRPLGACGLTAVSFSVPSAISLASHPLAATFIVVPNIAFAGVLGLTWLKSFRFIFDTNTDELKGPSGEVVPTTAFTGSSEDVQAMRSLSVRLPTPSSALVTAVTHQPRDYSLRRVCEPQAAASTPLSVPTVDACPQPRAAYIIRGVQRGDLDVIDHPLVANTVQTEANRLAAALVEPASDNKGSSELSEAATEAMAVSDAQVDAWCQAIDEMTPPPPPMAGLTLPGSEDLKLASSSDTDDLPATNAAFIEPLVAAASPLSTADPTRRDGPVLNPPLPQPVKPPPSLGEASTLPLQAADRKLDAAISKALMHAQLSVSRTIPF
jgi:hypothetical protein